MNSSASVLREERRGDRKAIERLHAAAFGGHAEADLVGALHEEDAVVLSLVNEQEGRIVGHVLYSRVTIETGTGNTGGLALAPLAVEPGRQRRGIGSSLVREAQRRLAARGEGLVFVVGAPAFYRRFGFSAALARGFRTPYDGAHVLALALKPGAGDRGIVRYPAAFTRLG